ncbi:uncharacterized protein [Haliotis asinina]|uniref:uncharacterized protein isoform X1 n=1 Tax=Haliotis asinina TaxID=109174 RepID=UPI0035320541
MTSSRPTNMQLGLRCIVIIIVFVIPLLGSKSCQNCKEEKCDSRGICTEGCKAGYTDKYCQHRCQETCVKSSCQLDDDSGKTVCSDGCEDGYCGPRCKIPCPHECLACDWHHCDNCTVCRADLYGSKCEHSCLQKCKGFACSVEGTCLEGCIAGRYGAHCNMSCLSAFQSCHRFTGQCQQCQHGHFGNQCQHLCPSCLTAEEEKLYTCRSGCKVCSSQYHPESQQCSFLKQNQNQDRQETRLAAILCIVILILIINIFVFIARLAMVCRACCYRGRRAKRGKYKNTFNDPSEMKLLDTEPTYARCATQTPVRRYSRADIDLHGACRKGDLAEVRRILDTGRGDVNCRGVAGITPLMEAARLGHRDVVKLLVSRGADVSLVDVDGNNILHYACVKGNKRTVEFALCLDEVDIDSRGGRGRTPVMDAACEGHSHVVKLLVSRGADVSLVDDDGNNILHYACVRGDRKTVEFVLSLGVLDINSRGLENRTPIMEVAGRGYRDLVELFVKRGADVSLVSDDGDNILHWACVGGDRMTVEFVLSLNVVNIDARNNNGDTAADVAKGKGHDQLFIIVVHS